MTYPSRLTGVCAMAFLQLRPILRCLKNVRTTLKQPQVWWRQGLSVRSISTGLPSTQISGPLVLKAAELAHLFDTDTTEAIYQGTPFEGLSQSAQGRLAEAWARRVLQEQHPESEILDPKPGTDCNGRSRSLHTAPYDFLMDGKRVEVKSGRLTWNSTMQVWCIRFWRIKQLEFDHLFLVLVCPDGVRLIRHDLDTGLSLAGHRTGYGGHVIQVCGSRQNACWQEALDTILLKLCEKGASNMLACESVGGKRLANMFFSRGAARTRAEEQYSETPLRTHSRQKRGLRIQAMGLAIDRMLCPYCQFDPVHDHGRAATRQRGPWNASADWCRGGLRVELKSSSLTWHKQRASWICHFGFIKPDMFDELWLAVYSPSGIHFFRSRSPSKLNFGTCGVSSEHEGLHMRFHEPANEADPLSALQVIETKMCSGGCELVAMVHWDEDSALEEKQVALRLDCAFGLSRTSSLINLELDRRW